MVLASPWTKTLMRWTPLISLAIAVTLSACGEAVPLELGEPVDDSAVLQFAEALELVSPAEVTLRGGVQEVCTASGCWFVLRERGDSLRDIRVDLLLSDFRLDADALGREVVVRGHLTGVDPDRELRALGLRLE